jgi:predicted  nucleic acid-binding Zn-ribbon protein
MANMKSLADYGKQILLELLKGNAPDKSGKATLNDVPLEDLRREKVRLELEERKMLARLQDVEKQKRVLFEEGVRSASTREQGVAARRIKELDAEAANMDHILHSVSNHKRVINGLIRLKERARVSAESGMTNLFKNINLESLIIEVDKASVDGELDDDKVNQLLRTLEELDSLAPGHKEEQDIQDIVLQMQKAREALDNPEAMDKQFDELNEHMKQAQQERTSEAGEQEI